MAQSLLYTSIVLLQLFAVSCRAQNDTLTLINSTTLNNDQIQNNGISQNNSTGQSSPSSQASSISSNFPFDCRQPSASCGSGICNLTNGECQCGATGTNFECAIAIPDGSKCNSPCLNGGACVSGTCVCGQSNYGSDCGMDRAQVICVSGGTMLVNINPIDAFDHGIIYVQSNPKCVFTNDTKSLPDFAKVSNEVGAFPEIYGWSGIFPSSDPNCAGIPSNIKNAEVKIYVQYNAFLKSAVDITVTARCPSTESNFTVGSVVTGIQDSDTDLDHIDSGAKLDVVTLEILTDNMQPVSGVVYLGAKIHLFFSMAVSSESVHTDFRLLNCVANNTLNGTSLQTILFLINECPSQGFQSIFYNLPTKFTNSTFVSIDVPLKAFMFVGSANVAFLCTLEFCGKNANNANCKLNDCPGYSANSATPSPMVTNSVQPDNTNNTSSNSTRTKRAADNNSPNVWKEIRVIDPNANESPVQTNPSATSEECITNPDIIAAIAILAVCVALLLIISVVLICRLTKSKKKSIDAKQDGMSRPVETMRFPRLELSTTHHDGC